MTELFVRRGKGAYTFGTATLRTRRTWRRGRIFIGDRPDLDLVVLTAFFALMTRRRQRTLVSAAIASAIR